MLFCVRRAFGCGERGETDEERRAGLLYFTRRELRSGADRIARLPDLSAVPLAKEEQR